jgi:hypothetical protein
MRVFGCDAAEIIPHAGDETPDLGLGKLRKGAANVAPSMFGNAEKRANAARQRTAKGGSAIERQQLERAEQERRAPGLQTIGEAGRASSNVRPSRAHRRGPIAQRAR